MNTTICLVRLGVTEWNYAGRVHGRSDVPLAPEGERQAEAVAARLAANGPWDAIYSSPLLRAYRTAMAITRRTGRDGVTPDPRLIEREMGAAEGMPDIDLPMLWPSVAWDEIPGMEPRDALSARAHNALAEIAVRHPGGRVVVVAHSSLIRAFLRTLGIDIHPRTVSVTTIEYDGERFALTSSPDHRHLLQDGIEYSGEKGRVEPGDLERLVAKPVPAPVIWQATAIETAWVDHRLVGFARAFTDGFLYGHIDIAVALPGYDQVRPVLIDRLKARYPVLDQ
jgi:uncharacterized phosphatase